jgi:hypothetical protein
MRVELRPTVAADLPQVIGEPLPHRIRAITALADGRVLGIGGIGFRPDGAVIAFVQMAAEARKYPAAIHRAGLAAMRMVRASGVPRVLAEAQPGNPAAARWLERLGFTRLGDVYVWRRAP